MKPHLKRPHDAKLVGDIATGQVVDECVMNSKLPKPSTILNAAAQCRAMGIMVGDTIEGRETHIGGGWNEARLTLLWLGEEIAVWHERTRTSREPLQWGWTMPTENANWKLECREWRKV